MGEKIIGRVVVRSEGNRAVLLDPCAEGRPLYKVYGRSPCALCETWCWLGKGAIEAVIHDGFSPLCNDCGKPFTNVDSFLGFTKE